MSLAAKIRKAIGRKKPITWERRPEILLCHNIPKPMHGLAPRVILGPVWWEQTRQAAYRSTAYHCVACGVYKYRARFRQWLEAHEVYDIDYLLGRMTFVEVVPLCHCCHNFIHSGRLAALLEEGKISHRKYAVILQLGEQVLREAGLRLPFKAHDGPTADWSDWRLVLFDTEYLPRYHSFNEWKKEYDGSK